jgi:flavin-dependent dehydrogenase
MMSLSPNFYERITVPENLPARTIMPNQSKHAIVIGGSIAGMITARVLAEQFDHVTIIERDALSMSNDFRKGVPQGKHPHILLKRGELVLNQLFPGFSDELESNGALPVNFGADVRWFTLGEWRPRYDSEIVILASSRPLLENTIRGRLAVHPKVRFLDDLEVAGLATNVDKTQATGVRVISRHTRAEAVIEADFVVDASGRESQAPEWLEELGYVPPQETKINAYAGYATRIFQRRHDVDFKVLYVQPNAPTQSRGAIIIPMEGNRWHVSLIGMSGDYPPIDEAGFMEFARSLPTPDIYEALKDAEPIGNIVGFRKGENRLYHYDALPRYLENFVLLGDSVYALNPVYGQGMSVAAMAAEVLAETLRTQISAYGTLTGVAEKFQKKLGEVIAMPWQMATGEDLRWPTTTGGENIIPDPAAMLMGNYLGKLMVAANHNPNVLDALLHVQNMIASPELFFRPDIVLQVVADGSPMFAPAPAAELEPELA